MNATVADLKNELISSHTAKIKKKIK